MKIFKNQSWKDEIAKMVRFGLVGLLNTAIGLGTIFLLQNLCGVDYRIANVIGYTLALTNSFFMNRAWTFRSQKKYHRAAISFLLVFAACFAVQFAVVVFLKEKIELNKNISQVLGMIVYTALNYLGNRIFTFNR